MDISQLRTVVCVAEFGSLSKAADHLCTAQPALSRQVRLLEEELGVRLFNRHGRGMMLTDPGRAVLQHAARIMTEIDEIHFSVAEAQSAQSGGRVSIGLAPTVAEMLAVPLLTSLRRARPNATFRILAAYSLYLLDGVHRGDIDLAVLYDPQSLRSLRSEPLLVEELHLIAPPLAGLKLDEARPMASLAKTPLLLPSGGHSLRQIIDGAALKAGMTPDVRLEVDSYETLRQLVAAGVGWTILPLAPVLADVAEGRLSAAPLVDPTPRRMLELAGPTDRPASRLACFVEEMLVDTVAERVRNGTWPGAARVR